MAMQEHETIRISALVSLIRFEDHFDGIVERLMDAIDAIDAIDDDLYQEPRDPQPTLRARDVSDLCNRVRRREISPVDVQRWAGVVKGISDIAVESQRLYAVLSELAGAAVTMERLTEIQMDLAA